MYYCASCNSVYDPLAYAALKKHSEYKDMVLCPNRACGGEIIDIDENFIPLMRTLRKLGILTTNCCSGHPWHIYDDFSCIYFAYAYDVEWCDEFFVEEFTNQLIKLSKTKKYSFLNIEFFDNEYTFMPLDGEPVETKKQVGVYANINEFENITLLNDHMTLLTRQLLLLEAVQIAINRTFEVLEKEYEKIDNVINLDTSEEQTNKEESALSSALKGSKIYLEAQGFLKNDELEEKE